METRHLRLLFLADAVAEDLPGGSRTAARELARGLTARGHEVTFLVGRRSTEAPDDEVKDGIRVLRYAGAGRAGEYIWSGREACRRLLTEGKFDLIHTQFAYSAIGPISALPKSLPQVRTFHGPWDQEGWTEEMSGSEGTEKISLLRTPKALIRRRLRYQIERRNLGRSAKVLTLSRCFQDMARTRYGVTDQQMEIIPGGTDTDAFRPLASGHPLTSGFVSKKAALRRRLALPTEGHILLSVRRLTPRMGLDRLIQAMPEIIARCPAACLVIGGEGPEEARLRQRIEVHGLSAHIRLLGFIPPDKLVSYYQAADLFILPSLALEGFGLVTTEALSCGLPVIGTPVGATPEILAPLDRRLIALSAEPHCLAEAVVEYLQGGWRQALTPEHLHEYVVRNFTWDRHVDRTEQVYQDLLTRPGHESGKQCSEPEANRKWL